VEVVDAIVIERLARRLLKCPFDQELFNLPLLLRLHLSERHETEICRRCSVPRQSHLQGIERPETIYLCGHCLNFVVPEAGDGRGVGEMERHIGAEHPNPGGPIELRFFVSKDTTLIDRLVEQESSEEARGCAYRGCSEVFADVDSVALHWAEDHCSMATVEEARRALEADPGRFRDQLAQVFAEMEQEEARKRLAAREPDDGYVIHHHPSVPRVRSRPAESILYVEREPVSFLDREVEDMLDYEGLDVEEEAPFGVEWPGREETVTVELRFCNILEGYVPLVKHVRRLLPPLADGEAIEASWQGESDDWFLCKVSRSKRAIYNLECRLKQLFGRLPSGVRLYVTRIGPRRYRLGVKQQQHVVRNCKVFSTDGRGRWQVEVRDEIVEWETEDQVFRHQLSFHEMEALRDEAQRTNLSVRDAVHEVMRRIGQSQPVHVRTVHDAVFLWMRTCSLPAVWAQFRPEHTCYVRVQPGWYRFDPAGRFPSARFGPLLIGPDQPPRGAKRYRVKSRGWRHSIYASRLEDYRDDPNAYLEVLCAFGTLNEAVLVIPMHYLLEKLIPHVGCNDRGEYSFTVNPQDFVFTWDGGFTMQGRPFLDNTAIPATTKGRATLPEGLKLAATYKGKAFYAEVIFGQWISFSGQVYYSPSAAAVAAIRITGSRRETQDGWLFWTYEDPQTGRAKVIDELRKEGLVYPNE
jgi:hypothetical protein